MPKRDAGAVKGLFTALITPFNSKGEVDVEALSRLVKFQVAKGAEGIFPCGSTGLGPMLAPQERMVVAAAVLEAAGGRVPIVVQVGTSDTGSAVELARHAERAGATAVAALTPYYYKAGEQAVRKHFERIASSVGLPVLAYNIPQFTGNNLTPGAAADLARDGVLAGIKESTRDFLQLLDLIRQTPDDFVVMNGVEEYGLFAIISGADGLVSGGASAVPELFASMVTAHRRGDVESARAAQRSVQKFKEVVKAAPIPSYYAILRERGVDCGDPRAPFLPLAQADATRLIEGVRSLGLL